MHRKLSLRLMAWPVHAHGNELGYRSPMVLGTPIWVLPSGSLKAMAWPVMHMAMNWAYGVL